MRILIVTPAARGSVIGNRVTAVRWAALLRQLGHRVVVANQVPEGSWEVLVALHAVKSRDAVAQFKRDYPGRPVILALTGTDLYDPTALHSAAARESLSAADRLVVLQPLGVNAVPEPWRGRARPIVQSARAPDPRPTPTAGAFRVCLLAHLRDVKDPLLAARAARRMDPASRLQIVHFGAAHSDEAAAEARREEECNPRYRWLGPVRRARALRELCQSHLLLVSSRLEGGANVVTEALACAVPVLSTRIDGSVGLLGPDYPGYFPAGDAGALAAALQRVETDAAFQAELTRRVEALRPRVHPDRERDAWRDLLAELAHP